MKANLILLLIQNWDNLIRFSVIGLELFTSSSQIAVAMWLSCIGNIQVREILTDYRRRRLQERHDHPSRWSQWSWRQVWGSDTLWTQSRWRPAQGSSSHAASSSYFFASCKQVISQSFFDILTEIFSRQEFDLVLLSPCFQAAC